MKNIFSFYGDKTTDIVIEYMRYFQKQEKIQVIPRLTFPNLNISISNDDNLVELIDTENNNITIGSNSSWLRRSIIKIAHSCQIEQFPDKAVEHLDKELELLRDFVYSYSLKIGSYDKEVNNNRISNILLAKQCGMKVPSTLITTKKSEVRAFFNTHDIIITKPIHNGHLTFETEDKSYYPAATTIVDKSKLDAIEDQFGPSLFQEYVEKEVELRVFYINNKIYPMAIFSQLNDKTKVDYRNYDNQRPNRNITFKLPESEEKKIHEFMKRLNSDTGSIDIILTPDNEFVFLEINPTGQFGWVSFQCNYYLEKEIAKNLCNYEA